MPHGARLVGKTHLSSCWVGSTSFLEFPNEAGKTTQALSFAREKGRGQERRCYDGEDVSRCLLDSVHPFEFLSRIHSVDFVLHVFYFYSTFICNRCCTSNPLITPNILSPLVSTQTRQTRHAKTTLNVSPGHPRCQYLYVRPPGKDARNVDFFHFACTLIHEYAAFHWHRQIVMAKCRRQTTDNGHQPPPFPLIPLSQPIALASTCPGGTNTRQNGRRRQGRSRGTRGLARSPGRKLRQAYS